MASPTRWTWVWVSSGSWWWTGKPGLLQSTGSQRVRQDWVTKLNWQGEGDDRGRDGRMASRTQWTWVWVNSGRWWWTGRPGVLQSMGSQRVRLDWATEQQREITGSRRDEKGTCKAALPLEVVPGARCVPFFSLTVVGLSINFWKL